MILTDVIVIAADLKKKHGRYSGTRIRCAPGAATATMQALGIPVRRTATGFLFGDIPVVEDPYIPAGFVILWDGEKATIIKLIPDSK